MPSVDQHDEAESNADPIRNWTEVVGTLATQIRESYDVESNAQDLESLRQAVWRWEDRIRAALETAIGGAAARQFDGLDPPAISGAWHEIGSRLTRKRAMLDALSSELRTHPQDVERREATWALSRSVNPFLSNREAQSAIRAVRQEIMSEGADYSRRCAAVIRVAGVMLVVGIAILASSSISANWSTLEPLVWMAGFVVGIAGWFGFIPARGAIEGWILDRRTRRSLRLVDRFEEALTPGGEGAVADDDNG